MEDFKKDIDSNTIIVGDFNTPLSKMDRSSKQNINKNIVTFNNTLDEMDLTDIYRAFHSKEAKYTFFSNGHGLQTSATTIENSMKTSVGENVEKREP